MAEHADHFPAFQVNTNYGAIEWRAETRKFELGLRPACGRVSMGDLGLGSEDLLLTRASAKQALSSPKCLGLCSPAFLLIAGAIQLCR